MGVFRGVGGLFTTTTYAEPATGALGQTALERQISRLDAKGIASCYDTSAGVGVGGASGADQRERKRGLHPALILVGVAVVAFLVWKVPFWLGNGVVKGFVGGGRSAREAFATNAPKTSVAVPSVPPAVVSTSAVPVSAPVRVEPPKSQPAGKGGIAPVVEDEEVYLTGLFSVGGKPRILLSDGSSYAADDREVELVTERFCVVGGRVYRWPKRSPKAASVEPAAGARVPSGPVMGAAVLVEGSSAQAFARRRASFDAGRRLN